MKLSFVQLIMTEPVEPIWDFGLSTNFGYEYFMQRPDGRILLGKFIAVCRTVFIGQSIGFGWEFFSIIIRSCFVSSIGGMRNIAPNMEVNNSDPATLNPQVSAELRAYLPRHFPQLRSLRELSSHHLTPPSRGDAASTSATSTTPASVAAAYVAAVVEEVSSSVASTAAAAAEPTASVDKGEPTIRVEAEWIGIMGCTPDRNPLVGPLSTRPGEFICAGYTGHGMPVAFLAGRNIADLICGVPSPVRIPPAYSPARYEM